MLDGWQELILEAAMGERSDRSWAAKRVGVTVPRQNGKSQLMVARILAGALLFGERKIVVSAHVQDTAREAFSKLMEIIEDDDNASLRSRLDPSFGRGGVMNALNREAVRFKTPMGISTVQFKARTGPGGKGFSSDCLLLDEAQILGSRAWTSINSTMSAMPNPQVWLLGTSPQEEDDAFTFNMVRQTAIDGVSTASAWCEWGLDTSSEQYRDAQADLAARKWTPAVELACWSANPAWDARINTEVVQGELETYAPDRFAQDRLGVWRSESDGTSRLITEEQWEAVGVDEPPADGIPCFGVAFSADGTRVSIGAALKREVPHVELVDAASGLDFALEGGVAPLADWLADPARVKRTALIVMSGRDGSPALFDALRARGVPKRQMHIASTTDYFAACSMFYDAVKGRSVTRLAVEGQAVLDASVAVSDRKARGQAGSWGWEATTPDGDETPVEAVSLALWAAKTTKRRPGGGGVQIL